MRQRWIWGARPNRAAKARSTVAATIVDAILVDHRRDAAPEPGAHQPRAVTAGRPPRRFRQNVELGTAHLIEIARAAVRVAHQRAHRRRLTTVAQQRSPAPHAFALLHHVAHPSLQGFR